eukprot:gene11130-3949_t
MIKSASVGASALPFLKVLYDGVLKEIDVFLTKNPNNVVKAPDNFDIYNKAKFQQYLNQSAMWHGMRMIFKLVVNEIKINVFFIMMSEIFESFEILSVVQMETQISNKIQTLILHSNSIHKNSGPGDTFLVPIAVGNIALKKVLKSALIESQKHYPIKLVFLIADQSILKFMFDFLVSKNKKSFENMIFIPGFFHFE